MRSPGSAGAANSAAAGSRQNQACTNPLTIAASPAARSFCAPGGDRLLDAEPANASPLALALCRLAVDRDIEPTLEDLREHLPATHARAKTRIVVGGAVALFTCVRWMRWWQMPGSGDPRPTAGASSAHKRSGPGSWGKNRGLGLEAGLGRNQPPESHSGR